MSRWEAALSSSRSKTVGRRSFLLHLHPPKVATATLHPAATLGLGVMAVALLAVLTLSGLFLMVHYTPHPDQAHADIRDIQAVVPFGAWLRSIHRFATHGLLLVVGLHMLRVFLCGAYRGHRIYNWFVGLGLLALMAAFAFTGYLLPWDQTSFWACTVGADMLGLVPGAGPWLRETFLGGSEVTGKSLLRLYVLHIALLPAATAVFLLYHLWRIRKDGGLARNVEESV